MPKGKAQAKTYLVEVAPITKAKTTDSLSYFSTTRLLPGALVKVPIRSSFVLSVVLRSRSALTARADIRRAGFLLKKIRQSDILEASIPPETLEALEDTARYYATSVGALLGGLLPKVLLDNPNSFLKSPLITKKRNLEEYSRDTLLLQMESEERFGQYRALVRQAFARGGSVMFVVPTHLDVSKIETELSKGITEFVHRFTLTGNKEAMKKAWLKALHEPHPILFITTPAGLFLPRSDIETIIVERENSRAYRTLARPFIHLRTFIEAWAKRSNKQLVLGDSVLTLETLWKEKNGEYGESTLLRWRLPAAPAHFIDAKAKQNERGRFEIFSKELKEMITKALSENEKVFLFGARKGLAPTTVCGDCGTVLPCLNCGAGVVLHRHGETNVYICHACSHRRESATTCSLCGSWKLVPLGIGTEEIARLAKDLFPKQKIFILDKDYASTDKKAQAIVKKFQEEGGIMVGTELAFYHLDRVPYSALVSVDALFSIPDFGINERIFYLVSRLREMTQKESIIQTRNIGKQILAWAAQGNILDFYQNEIAERETLLYPPFSIFVKITVPKKDAPREIPKLKERLARFHPDTLRDSVIIRVARSAWPDQTLLEELALLPQEFSIKVDPESIL